MLVLDRHDLVLSPGESKLSTAILTSKRHSWHIGTEAQRVARLNDGSEYQLNEE